MMMAAAEDAEAEPFFGSIPHQKVETSLRLSASQDRRYVFLFFRTDIWFFIGYRKGVVAKQRMSS
jgi:hypothetical protein